jgi:hypothetical protein
MRMALAALLTTGALVLGPEASIAESAQQTESPAVAPGSDSSVHATRGVVRSIDATTLVVARPKSRGDIVFKLSPTLHRDGQIKAGSTVSVRYRDEGKDHVATAISRQKPHE